MEFGKSGQGIYK
ncbi:hypothetical protein BOTNAR_0397g00010 [Botryotinia narcissicola]|uniref:Uncharacterized protein n=1 Tax=Botryotinia narcissicola TaxID=278944 RepID=A0A4Z1HN46_9HELO|nr:hypothetical protein BOTNAR_0397g00010 [Botryotinia narcissicola]